MNSVHASLWSTQSFMRSVLPRLTADVPFTDKKSNVWKKKKSEKKGGKKEQREREKKRELKSSDILLPGIAWYAASSFFRTEEIIDVLHDLASLVLLWTELLMQYWILIIFIDDCRVISSLIQDTCISLSSIQLNYPIHIRLDGWNFHFAHLSPHISLMGHSGL